RPNKPGFMVIGTQNPVTMAGRKAQSTALSRRLITSVLPPYTDAEMHAILCQKGVDQALANALIQKYNQECRHAESKGLSPVPCFRDLIREAEYAKGNALYQPERPAQPPKEVSSPLPLAPKVAREPAKTPLYSFLFDAAYYLSCILCAAAFALALLTIAASPAGIGTAVAVGVSFAAGLASFGFYKAAEKTRVPEKEGVFCDSVCN
ncbi:MAG: hypothetical protein WC785_10760, partial [Tatlockia sp.]